MRRTTRRMTRGSGGGEGYSEGGEGYSPLVERWLPLRPLPQPGAAVASSPSHPEAKSFVGEPRVGSAA